MEKKVKKKVRTRVRLNASSSQSLQIEKKNEKKIGGGKALVPASHLCF
jgi:hypothetical protein